MYIIDILEKEANLEYKQFQEKICKTKYPMLGVKIPTLRQIAKKMLKNAELSTILLNLDTSYYETVMLKGLVIGRANISYQEKIPLISDFLPLIDNWAICDTFCNELKFVKDNKKEFLEYLETLINSQEEYYLRFVIVILLLYYINDEYISYVLEKLLTIKSNKYYVSMALSWAYSYCFIKYFSLTKEFFIKNKANIPKWVYNKSLQKALESYQISEERKEILRTMKI